MATRERRKIVGAGGSKAVTLPSAWLDYHNVQLGDDVEVITKDKTVIIRLMPKINGEGNNNGCRNGESDQD